MERPPAIRDLSAFASEDRIALIDSGGNIVGSNDIWMPFAQHFARVQFAFPREQFTFPREQFAFPREQFTFPREEMFIPD